MERPYRVRLMAFSKDSQGTWRHTSAAVFASAGTFCWKSCLPSGQETKNPHVWHFHLHCPPMQSAWTTRLSLVWTGKKQEIVTLKACFWLSIFLLPLWLHLKLAPGGGIGDWSFLVFCPSSVSLCPHVKSAHLEENKPASTLPWNLNVNP